MADEIAPRDGELVIDLEAVRIAFTVSGGKVALTGLGSPAGGEWLAKPADDSSVWKLALRSPEGKTTELTSSTARLTRAQRSGSLAWEAPLDGQAPQPPDNAYVSITISEERKRQGLSRWELLVQLPKGWSVDHCDFPIIPNVALRAGLKLAAPVGWGLEYSVEPGMGYGGTYPSCQAAMQFVAFYAPPHPNPLPRGERESGRPHPNPLPQGERESGHPHPGPLPQGEREAVGSGLYIGLHDPEGNHKRLQAKAGADTVGFACTNWPALNENGVLIDAVVGVFRGDYYDAAQIYREFTFTTPWGKGGPVSKRPIPQWLKDTDLWLMPAAEPVKNVDEAKKAMEYFGVPTALHWYNWHQIPFDTLYPDYFPAKEHFAEGVKALEDAGFHVMPYINGRLCDPNSKAWNEEGADRAAARQEDGKPYTEVYGSKVPLNVMCPWTSMWQSKITGLVDKLVNQYGVNGVYIDQISAAAPERCFSAEHGHPIGGGHFWVDGYRKLLNQVRARLPKDAMITTEEDGECWIDQFDALLLVNTASSNAAHPIPLFPAVYSGRAITFGFQYIKGDDITKSIPWRAKMARAFTWGSQLGWVRVGAIMAPEAAEEAESLRNLARCRKYAHKFVVTGRFLGMLDLRGYNPHVRCEATGSFGGTYMVDMPSVIASAWLAEDDSLGVLLANMSDDPRDVEVTLPLAKAGIDAFAGYTVKTFGSGGLVSTEQGTSVVRKVTVARRSAAVVEVSAR